MSGTMENGNTGSCKVGDDMTHPAFLSIPSIGFWVGKFDRACNQYGTTENIAKPYNTETGVLASTTGNQRHL